MLKILFLSLVLCASFVNAQLRNFTVQEVSYEWETDPELESFKRIMVDAVYEGYKSIPPADLGITTNLKDGLWEWADNGLMKILAEIQEEGSEFKLLTAKKDAQAVGYAIFDMGHYPEYVYLSELVVDPAFQRQGIGRQLVFSILEQFPDTKKLVLITRKANSQACAFYPAIGFRPSDYMHEGYNPKIYRGFEFIPSP